MRYSQDPCPRWVTHKWEDLTRAEFSLRSKGSASHISTPSPGAWHWADKPPEHLALKASRAWGQEGWRAVGNRNSLLKGTCKISHAPKPSTEAVLWDEPGSDHLGEPPGESGGNQDSPGEQELAAAALGSLSYHKETGKHFFGVLPLAYWASLVTLMVKSPPAMQETRVRSLAWEDPLEKEIVTHSSILAWGIPWTEEPGGLQSLGLQRVGHSFILTHTHTHTLPSSLLAPEAYLSSSWVAPITNPGTS